MYDTFNWSGCYACRYQAVENQKGSLEPSLWWRLAWDSIFALQNCAILQGLPRVPFCLALNVLGLKCITGIHHGSSFFLFNLCLSCILQCVADSKAGNSKHSKFILTFIIWWLFIWFLWYLFDGSMTIIFLSMKMRLSSSCHFNTYDRLPLLGYGCRRGKAAGVGCGEEHGQDPAQHGENTEDTQIQDLTGSQRIFKNSCLVDDSNCS